MTGDPSTARSPATRLNTPSEHVVGDLLHWIDDPVRGRGIRFFDDGGGWTQHSYAELARTVRSAAAAIKAHQAHPGGHVALILPTGPQFVVAFLATLHAGAIPCPIAPPAPFQDGQAYHCQLREILRVACPALVVTAPELEQAATDALHAAGLQATPLTTSLDASDEQCSSVANELGLLQFTSGSSGRPRGVRISRMNLEANIEMIRRWVALAHDDVVVSWLPLLHDMGLIGALLTTVTTGVDLMIMRPDQFIRAPELWLECFGSGPGTIGVSPTFGFAYAARRVLRRSLSGSDFSRWRVAFVGAERIDAGVLAAFASLCRPYGFRAEAFLPAYGLAEATLAATGANLDHPSPIVRVAWSALALNRPVQVLGKARLGHRATRDNASGWLVSCGRPHPGVRLAILADDGKPLPEGHLGQIALAGVTIAEGYEGQDATATSAFATDGQLLTGDAGFLLDGELYVVGRMGDSVKVRGRSVYMEDVENRLARIPGISAGRCVAFAGRSADADCLLALVEADQGEWLEQAAAVLERAAGGELEIGILQAPRGTIARTTSGKPRRRVMWRAHVEGRLTARWLWRQVPSSACQSEAPAADPIAGARR